MQAAFRVARSLFSRGGRPLTPAEAETVDVAALLQAVHVITPAEGECLSSVR